MACRLAIYAICVLSPQVKTLALRHASHMHATKIQLQENILHANAVLDFAISHSILSGPKSILRQPRRAASDARAKGATDAPPI